MATITTDTYLDGGVARTAGETWTLNGGVLTIRTDTRWHADAPAAMTGSIGATTSSATLGGGVFIDATAVRWLAYDTGSGNVPAIGTDITQGGVTSSYLLAVYADLTSAPTAVGAAMPASGYIKFREVYGAFAAGALTGIGANALGADTVGWIEVVQRQAVANSVPRLGFFRTRGDWFELPQVTSGSADQTIQIPTNGGGAGTHVPAIWIETDVGTGVYEAYPAVLSTWFNNTNLGTDERSKFVQTLGSGQVRIGYNGTNNVGFVPPAGCRIRIPNIIGRQSTSAGGDANNQVPHATIATRPDFATTNAGEIDIEYFLCDWYYLFASPYSIRIVHSATFDILSISNAASPDDINDIVTGSYLGTSIPLTLSSNSLGGTIQNCKFHRAAAASNGHAASLSLCADYTFNNNHFGVIQYARSTGRSISVSQCQNCVFNNTFQYNAYAIFLTSFNCSMTNIDHCDRYIGSTNTTTGMYCVQMATSCDNIIVDGLTFGLNGLISDYCNPYLAPFGTSNSSNITFRNAGTRTNPLAVASAALGPQYAAHDAGVNTNVRFQRIYMEHTRTNVLFTINTSKNITFEDVHGTVGAIQTVSLNTLVKGVRATSNSVTGGAAVYGTHYFDMFESDTAGRVWFAMNEPTEDTASLVTLTLAGTTGGFTSAGQVSMPTTGDELIIEMPYYVLGHTGFENTAATLTGTLTGNLSYEYQIDINDGTGWDGVWKTIDGTNLSAETIDPSLGFKLKIRITATATATTTALTYIRINTTTTLAAQTNNLYQLDPTHVTVTLENLKANSEVRAYIDLDGLNGTEIDGIEDSGTSYSFLSPMNSGINIMIHNLNYLPGDIWGYEVGEEDITIPIVQVIDRFYNNPPGEPPPPPPTGLFVEDFINGADFSTSSGSYVTALELNTVVAEGYYIIQWDGTIARTIGSGVFGQSRVIINGVTVAESEEHFANESYQFPFSGFYYVLLSGAVNITIEVEGNGQQIDLLNPSIYILGGTE